MSLIRKLTSLEIQKIAAGQVVERPAHAVKELLENAFDAGATHITIRCLDGGKSEIRIIDDGCGMRPDDARLAFENHATSKMVYIDELSKLSTYGFRGEALASIAAVSKVRLVTKPEQELSGTLLKLENATIVEQQEIGASTGTDITISDLFYNVPARKKFLKSKDTEWRHIEQLVHAYAIAYPHVDIKLYADDKLVLHAIPTQSITERARSLAEISYQQALLAVDEYDEKRKLHLQGVVSSYTIMRYDRSCITFLVNNRWVKNQRLGYALVKGYANVLPQGKFPYSSLMLTVQPEEVDINVHPRKEEVLFAHPAIVEQFIEQTVKKRLEQAISEKLKRTVTIAPAEYKQDLNSMYSPAHFPLPKEKYIAEPLIQNFPIPKREMNDFRELPLNPQLNSSESVQTHIELTEPLISTYTIIGQILLTYILLEQQEGLYIIDQHAAHERILYEQFASRFEHIPTVSLIFSQTIAMTEADLTLLEPYLVLIKGYGIEASRGPGHLLVSGIPIHAKQLILQDFFGQFISWIKESDRQVEQQVESLLHHNVRAMMACKAAVKAGDSLSQEQMEQIVKDLLKSPNRFSCPHGRPTGWLLGQDELEKRFKRRI